MTTHLSTEPDGKAPNLIVLTHGCCTDENGVKEWDRLAEKIAGKIINSGTQIAWEIVVWDWTADPPDTFTAAPDNAGKQGVILSNVIEQQQHTYQYIHFIGHSAGAGLIDLSAKRLVQYYIPLVNSFSA